MQGPEIHLTALGIDVPCVVKPGRPARLDADHRVFVNWETYYLSDAWALAAFCADPVRYVGTVTDPVSRERFRPDASSPRAVHGVRIVFFATAAHAERFRAAPEAYATPMIGMAGDR